MPRDRIGDGGRSGCCQDTPHTSLARLSQTEKEVTQKNTEAIHFRLPGLSVATHPLFNLWTKMATPLENKRLLRKAAVVCLSIIPAILAMTITNALIAHIIVAKTLIFRPRQPTGRKAPRVETVFVAPTQKDVDRIRKELDKSEPMPKIVPHDDSRTAAIAKAEISELLSLVETRDSDLSTLVETREKALTAAKNEIAELLESFSAHQERVEQDTSQDLAVLTPEVIEFVEENDLLGLLSRHSFADLDREILEELFEMAMFEAEWLLDVDDDDEESAVIRDALLLNINGTLLASFGSLPREASNGSSCEAFLALDRNEVAEEFIPPPRHVVKKSKPKPKPVAIPADTARESDLHEIVHKIKDTLSRRDLSSIKLEEGESYPSPLGDEGSSMVLKAIVPLIQSLKAKRAQILEEEQRIIQQWRDRPGELKPEQVQPIREDCANSEMVKSLVTTGLGAIRAKNELHVAWITALHKFVTDPEALARMRPDIMKLESSAIDYTERPEASRNGKSSWKTGRKSVSYIADGPLLQRGLVRSIDWFVDAISGYNDSVDAILDWIVGDSGLSLGTTVAESISRSLRRIPFPHDKVDRLKRSGILSGRARTMLDDPVP